MDLGSRYLALWPKTSRRGHQLCRGQSDYILMGNLHRCNQEAYNIYKSLDSGKEVCALFYWCVKSFW